MYELYRGSERLSGALYAVMDDKNTISILAKYLYYVPDQLQEDIQALDDRLHQEKWSSHAMQKADCDWL